ncbi:MAG: hypothetical protein J0I13_00920, partial [Rhizobiales bacterium]|nr:hypothetical protein [Hyphomicrobiales bacterium]
MGDDDAGGGWIGRLRRFLGAREDDDITPRPPAPAAREASSDTALLDAAVAGMPDPVVVLDRAGHVLAFNAGAAALAPALRRGEPASIGLRMPELVEAIRDAIQIGTPQRVELSTRLPAKRFSEAFVTPVTRASAPGGGVVVVTIHDLTPIHRVEEMRADFVANV